MLCADHLLSFSLELVQFSLLIFAKNEMIYMVGKVVTLSPSTEGDTSV